MFENITFPKELKTTDPRFCCGPSLVPPSHLQSLAETGVNLMGNSHRKSAVKNLIKDVQEGMKDYFQLPDGYEVVVGNGGATLLWDMIGLGMVEKSSLHYTCGEFSSKWFKCHNQIPWIEATDIKADYGFCAQPQAKEGFDFIATTLNETSTGVQISDLPKLNSKDVLVGMDATSGAGQIPVDVSKVDVFYFSAQKVFASEGGTFISFLSPNAIERALKLAEEKNRYVPEILKWSLMIDNSRKNQTYNTPSVSTFFLVNEQLKKMSSLGRENVYAQAKEKADLLYSWAEEKPYLSCYVKNPQERSLSVATIDLDEKYPAGDLTKVLREQNIAYDVDAYRKLGRNQLRIAFFHNILKEDIQKLIKAVDYAIENA